MNARALLAALFLSDYAATIHAAGPVRILKVHLSCDVAADDPTGSQVCYAFNSISSSSVKRTENEHN